jgi:hypothetical protein
MAQRKLWIVEKMAQKGISVAEAAEAISFNSVIIVLYLAKDAYPVPERIPGKLEGTIPY